MTVPATPPLDPRARQLLRTLIGRYIRDGEPVGSQTLARHAGLDVSPATIRNILADLEDSGLLSSPHTSAGRVPTAQGYRVFVDSLLQVRSLAEREVARLRAELTVGAGGTRAVPTPESPASRTPTGSSRPVRRDPGGHPDWRRRVRTRRAGSRPTRPHAGRPCHRHRHRAR